MKNQRVLKLSVAGVCAFVLMCLMGAHAAAEDSNNSNAANPAAGQPPANPNPATGQANKSAQQNEADVEDLVVVRGKFYANKEDPGAAGGGEVGTIVSENDSLKVLTIDEAYIKKLKTLDNKAVSLKGKLNDKDKTLRLYQILDDVLPAAENSNPRGL